MDPQQLVGLLAAQHLTMSTKSRCLSTIPKVIDIFEALNFPIKSCSRHHGPGRVRVRPRVFTVHRFHGVHLHEAIRVHIGDGTAVGGEGEFAFSVLHTWRAGRAGRAGPQGHRAFWWSTSSSLSLVRLVGFLLMVRLFVLVCFRGG